MLREIAGGVMQADVARRDALLARNAAGVLDAAERVELDHLRRAEDIFMLRKAHAAALLGWRGRAVRAR